MVWIIVAGALGVIIITGGLFLRRLLGELTALRGQLTEQGRQITGIDRQMRAQRAHVNILRQLLADDGDDNDDGDGDPPPPAAVVNGHEPPVEHPTDGPEPIRRKRHLGLYIGGAAAAITALSSAARDAVRTHQAQVIGAVTGSAITAATVSLVVVQPWSHDTGYDYEPPAAIPSVSVPPTYAPPRTPEQPGASPPPAARPSPTADATSSSASPTATVSISAGSGSPSPTVSGTPVVPIGQTSPSESPPEPPGAGDGASDSLEQPPGGDGPPGPGTSPTPPSEPPPAGPADEASGGLCLSVSASPLLELDTCLLDG